MASYSHQDWNTVIFKKTQPKETKVLAKTNASTVSYSAKPAWKVEQQVDSDTGKPINFVSKTDADFIVKARVNAKLTQKQLAQRLNMQEKEIKDIETCKAVENKATLAKIKRVLNIQ